jgi:heat shock protein HtpX
VNTAHHAHRRCAHVRANRGYAHLSSRHAVSCNEGIMRTLKTGMLLTALTLLLVLGGRALAGSQGMTFGLVLAVAMNGFAYFFSDKIALASSGARPVSREELPRLYEVMERLAAKGQLPMPKLYVIPQPAPNAFATGRNPSHASVAVTEGLLQLMTDDELEGVIAHELSHVRNYDILTTSIAATLAGAITWIANIGRWAMIFGGYGGRDERRGGMGDLLMLFIAPFAALIIQLGISRQREYAADASGARLVGHPYGLISALEKLGAYNNRIPMTNVSPATAPLYIVMPLSAGQVFSGIFSTHPPLSDRIAALRQMTVTR